MIVDMLRTAGFFQSEISVLIPNHAGKWGSSFMSQGELSKSSATRMAKTEALIGALGWMEDLGGIAIPRLGPFIAAGPIRAKLSGLTGRWSSRGVTEALIEMGVAQDSAKICERTVAAGYVLISLHSANDEEIAGAESIFEAAGVVDIWLTEERSVKCRQTEPVC